MHMTTSIGAGQRLEFYSPGDFFRLMAATDTINVSYYKNGAEITEANNVSVGYAERFTEEQFDRISIFSTNAQTITIATRLGNEVWYDTPPNGQVTVTNVSGAFANVQKTVTSSSTSMLTAKPSRRYLLIQNNDATGDIYVRLDGTAATLTTGVKIPAGGSYEVTGYVPTGAITAIGSIASNANIVVVEG